jgi:hypothetical protein
MYFSYYFFKIVAIWILISWNNLSIFQIAKNSSTIKTDVNMKSDEASWSSGALCLPYQIYFYFLKIIYIDLLTVIDSSCFLENLVKES